MMTASTKQTTISRNSLRKLAQNALEKNLFLSAALIMEKLIGHNSNLVRYKEPILDPNYLEDCILYARSFYLNGEPRRCLAILEQKQLLSATLISYLADIINPQSTVMQDDNIQNSSLMRSICLHLEGIQLAAQCLFVIDQFDDCSALLEPLIYVEADESWMHSLVNRLRILFSINENTEINQMSAIYCLFGKCNDILDNRSRSLRALTISVLIDVACSEAAEYIVNSGMLSLSERRSLFSSILKADGNTPQREWIIPFYEYLLLDQDPTFVDLVNDQNDRTQQVSVSPAVAYQMSSASWLVRQAEFNFNHQFIEDAYRLARHAYTIDMHDNRGLIIYIASMVELKLKTELFYLGHELVIFTV
jgi:hypothetical protein